MKLPFAGRPAACIRALLVAATWVTGFSVTAWIAGVCLPPAELPWLVRQKIDHLARQGDAYDILFIGSSHMQFHIMPSVFDHFLAGHGIALKSFNAGVAAMAPLEDGYFLDEILRLPHRRLRWIFIELAPVRSGIDRQRTGTERADYWHDWERFIIVTKRALQRMSRVRKSLAASPTKPWRERIEACIPPLTDFTAHARSFAVRSVHFGRGAIVARGWILPKRQKRPRDDGALGTDGDGWSRSADALQRISGERLAHFEAAYANCLRTPSRQDTEDDVSDEALEILLPKVRRAGAVPILVVPPTPSEEYYFPRPERARELAIFDFSDVRKYPDLFRTENRQDIDHLNAAGAELFTRILADRFLEIARPPQSPHSPR